MSTEFTLIQSAQTEIEHEQLVRLCKASADLLRLNILRVLQKNSYAVQELCEIFKVKQSAMSHHLKLLSQAGLIGCKREGNTLFYRRQPSAHHKDFQNLHNGLLQAVDRITLDTAIAKALYNINSKRSERSLKFFTEHVEQFQTRQDLIAEYPQYGATVAALLNALAEGSKQQLALEVGPGEGQFLIELSTRFQRVLALDNNVAMLHKARQLQPLDCSNIQWLHGDTQHSAIQNINADLIVLNMVLHHTPAPADIFQHLAGAIAPRGTLIITDLCRHDQDWAKESCGDLWLGFDTEELINWADKAGFKVQQTIYLSLLNGFRIQICLFTNTR